MADSGFSGGVGAMDTFSNRTVSSRVSTLKPNIKQTLELLEKAGLKPGRNWQREFTELLTDLANRDNLTPLEIIKTAAITKVLQDKKLNGPQKLAKVKAILLAKRYPVYTKAKQAFQQRLKEVSLSKEIKIKPTPFFEDNKITVEFSYTTKAELEKIIKELEKLKKVDLVKDALQAAEDSC